MNWCIFVQHCLRR